MGFPAKELATRRPWLPSPSYLCMRLELQGWLALKPAEKCHRMSLNLNDRAQSHSRSRAERRGRGEKASSRTAIQRGHRKSPDSITASHPPPRLRQDAKRLRNYARWRQAGLHSPRGTRGRFSLKQADAGPETLSLPALVLTAPQPSHGRNTTCSNQRAHHRPARPICPDPAAP